MAFTKPDARSLRRTLGPETPVEIKKLFGFERVTLAPGSSTTVSFTLNPSHLAMADAEGNMGLHSGRFELEFTRGYGDVLTADAMVATPDTAASRLKTFRKWW